MILLILYSIIFYILFPLLHLIDKKNPPVISIVENQACWIFHFRDTCHVYLVHSDLCITSLLLSCLNISLYCLQMVVFSFLLVLLPTVCLLYSNVNVTSLTEPISLISLRRSREREGYRKECGEVWRGYRDVLLCGVCPPQYLHMETQRYSDELQSGDLCYWKGQSYGQWHVHLRGTQPNHENDDKNDTQTRSDR